MILLFQNIGDGQRELKSIDALRQLRLTNYLLTNYYLPIINL
jgi:hypothetical protein